MAKYQEADSTLWTGRDATEDLYWHQKVKLLSLSNPFNLPEGKSFGILGYQSDEGVRRNLGRVGAASGPLAIRRQMGAMANHLPASTYLVDFGDVICDHEDLEGAHRIISEKVTKMLKNAITPILLGGGHDLAYAHYKGIKDAISDDLKVGILNLDAHFDLRAVVEKRNSGTPFYQIMEQYPDTKYSCYGIQKPANNRELFDYAKSKDIDYLLAEHFHINKWKAVEESLMSFIGSVDKIYLTIDLDGFSSAYAPGVSAPSPYGFEPLVVLKTVDVLKSSGRLLSVDIVELNPLFDIDNATARLAARLIERMV